MSSCFICNKKSEHFANWADFEYVRCVGCGLVYLKDMPTEREIYEAYSGGKFKSFRRKITAPFRSIEKLKGYENRVADFEKRLKHLIPFVNDQRGELLDIGCNKGFLLSAAINLGFDVSGIELVPELTIQFKRKYPQYAKRIIAEDFSKAQEYFGTETFDVVTAFDLVEHLREPKTDFEKIFKLMKPGGVFLFQTPNTLSEESISKGESWGALKAFEHYHLFNPSNIEVFGKQLGFTEVHQIESDLLTDGDMMVLMIK